MSLLKVTSLKYADLENPYTLYHVSSVIIQKKLLLQIHGIHDEVVLAFFIIKFKA